MAEENQNMEYPIVSSPQVSSLASTPPIVKAIVWVLCIFCFIPLATGDTTIPSAAFFLVGLVLCPPVIAMVQKISGRVIGGWPRAVCIIALMAIAGRFIGKENEEKKDANTRSLANTAATVSPTPTNDSPKATEVVAQPKAKTASAEWQEPETADDEELSFAFGVKDYISWVNKNLAIAELPPIRITSRKKSGEETTHIGKINKYIGIMIYEDQDKRVSTVILIGQGDGTVKSGANVMLATFAAVKGLHQTAEKDKHLGKLALELMKTEREEIIDRGVKYHASMLKEIGFMLTMSPVRE